MQRERAMFAGSRLYRQAAEGSNQLLDSLQNNAKNAFEPILRDLCKDSDHIQFQRRSDCNTYLNLARNYLHALCQEISPYIAIPVLIQATTDFYYGQFASETLPWFGTAAKIALAFIWRNVHTRALFPSKSLQKLEKIIVASGVYEQLYHLANIYEIYGEGVTELRGDGFYTTDDKLITANVELHQVYRERGRAQRTLADSIQTINLQPTEALVAIRAVLTGSSPANLDLFQGTIFALIPPTDPPEFWVGLWARLLFMLRAYELRSYVSDNPYGIALFATHALAYPKGMDSKLNQRIAMQIFWQQEWHKTRIRETAYNINNMIVERPIIRLSIEEDLFATSSILIADSINWFVEESVMRYPGRGGVPLSDIVFKHGVSEKFEIQVRNTFQKYLFLAGYVAENGTWHIEDQHFQLLHTRHKQIPGEIDVLAYHPVTQELFVVECKVLNFPSTVQKVRNIISKIGDTDTEGFHKKIKKKIDWLKETDVFSFFPVSQFVGLIVLDRTLPGMAQGELPTINFDMLSTYLGKHYKDFV